MQKRNRKPKLSDKECKQSVLDYFERQKEFKNCQAQFNELKEQFNSDMEDYFECLGVGSKLYFGSDDFIEDSFTVNRIQKSSVVFDPEKLECALGKDISKSVIIKKYEIIDVVGLIAYLKTFGVDPKVFKSFLSVSKSVDTNELDRLEELGKITAKQVEGCYTVKRQKPYFTVNVSKGRNND